MFFFWNVIRGELTDSKLRQQEKKIIPEMLDAKTN